jgi:hypothetical protein
MKTCDYCKQNASGVVPYLVCENCNSLFYAAPDLLKALKMLLDEFNSRTALIETCDMDDDELKAIKLSEQAISKAEGR